MVKSRKYAIVTAALALVLIAAVVLTVVLVGNGTLYTPEEGGSTSNAAVTVTASTGTVPNRTEYIFETLTENSAVGKRGNGWQISDRNDEGVFETTLNSKFYLLSDYTYDQLISNNIPGVASGVYEMTYNGATYRFRNGNSGLSGDMSSLYRTFTMFMTNSSFYQDTAVYGLIFTDTVSYNPNDTFSRSWFDATLDGAGATIKPSAVLNVTDSYTGSGAWPHEGNNTGSPRPYASGVAYMKNNYLTANEWQMNRNENGTGFVGLLFGGLRGGTFMNFQWNDSEISGTHTYILQTEQYGTAFGGLVGMATSNGNYTDTTGTQDPNVKSSVYNVSMSFNNDIVHSMQIVSSSSGNSSLGRNDIYSGGLIGVNLNADIELVSINYNTSTFYQNAARLKWHSITDPQLAWGTSSFGGVVGAQAVKNNMPFVFSKVTLTGKSAAALVGDDTWKEFGSTWATRVSNVYTQQGALIGGVSGNLTIDGVILDMNYDNIYTWWNWDDSEKRDSTDPQRGILAGHIYSSTITHRNIYLTSNASSNSMDTLLNNLGTGNTFTINSSYFGSQKNVYYAYVGGVDGDNSNRSTSRAFIYADESVIGSINFAYVDPDKTYGAGEVEPVVEISRPTGGSGVMWDIRFYANGDSNSNYASYDLFTQNAYTGVQVGSVTSYPSAQYLRMSITYASSYSYTVVNGHGNNGSADKYYDGTAVNYPTLDLTDNQVISSYGSDLFTSNGYVMFETSGNGTWLRRYNGSGGEVGSDWTIASFYDANGTATGNSNTQNIIASILQLENNTEAGFAIVGQSQWASMVNANTYRWSSVGLFAFENTSGNRKYVFAPATASSAEVHINQRPLYLDVVNDEVPYIAQGYRLEEGGDGSMRGVINYTLGTTATGNPIIGNDQVTVQAVLANSVSSAVDAGTYTLSANTLGGGSANNYMLVGAPNEESTFVINPAQVTLTVNGGTMTYGTTLTSRTDFMNLVHYTLSFAQETGLTEFAARDNITLNLNLQTGSNATQSGQLLFDAAQGSSLTGQQRFTYNFPVGAYDVIYENITGSGANNYAVTLASTQQKFQVQPATLHFDLGEIDDFTYGDMATLDPSSSYNGLVGTDTIAEYVVNYFTAEDGNAYNVLPFGAGSYYAQGQVTAINSPGSVDGIDNYSIVYNKQTFEVAKRDTAVQFDFDPSAEYIFKGEAYVFTPVALTNAAFTDGTGLDGKVTFQAYGDVNRENAVDAYNAGTYYPGAVSDVLSANYNITGVTDSSGNAWTSFVIGRASVTLSNDGVTTATYSGSPISYDAGKITIGYGDVDALADEAEALKAALVYAYNGANGAPVNAGTYNVTVTLPQQTNFNSASLSITGGLVIEQMTITITPDSGTEVSAVYSGEMIPDLTYTVTGGGQPIEGLEITTAYRTQEGTATSDLRNVGTYTITYSYDGSTGNYKSATATVTYTVTAKEITLTLANAQVVYNKETYSPDFTVEGVIVGDNADIGWTVKQNDADYSGDVINAGEYYFTFTAGNTNYTISAESAQQKVTIEKYTISAQAVNTTVLFNSANLDASYYLGGLHISVIDADGTDIAASVQAEKQLITSVSDTTPVDTVNDRGGDYAIKVSITLPEGYNADNYTVEDSIYAVFIYRIALSGQLVGGESTSVTYGTDFNVKGVLTAMAGEETEGLVVDASGNVTVDGADFDDVTSITVTSASMSVSGVTLALTDNTVDLSNISTTIDEIFNSGVLSSKGFANAGTYTATIEITVSVVYTDTSLNREITISAPFTWTVNPYEIQVTAGDVNKYYTESVTTADVLGAVTVEEEYKDFITAVSSVIDDTSSVYVNAGSYTYDVVLNTAQEGYYNYTLADVITGNIVIAPLSLVVTVGNASVQYGDPIVSAASASAQLYKGEELFEDAPAGIASQYSWTLASTQSVGTGVGTYENALTANVTATGNFKVTVNAGDLTITKRMLQIGLNNVSMTYSNSELDITYYITGGSLYGNDELPVLTYDSVAAGDKALNRLDVNEEGYSLTVNGAAFDNENYGIDGAVTAGTLTVTPYQITSVTWNAPVRQLVYKGAEFGADELYSVEAFTNDNGDVVTFAVSYGNGVTVMNAGAYSARVSVSSVLNGEESVNTANYSVANVAAQSFSVAKANLTITEVGGTAAVDGAVTYTTTFNNQAQTITSDMITFSFGEGLTYSSDRDGTLNVTVTYRQSGATASTVNAGTYNVVVSVSGDNFANATLTNVTMVVERWILTQEELSEVADIEVPQDVMYDSQAHGATITFMGMFTGLRPSYTFTYTNGEGEAVQPVDAGSYAVSLVIDTANVYYATPEGGNEGTVIIVPTTKFTLSASVPSSTGLNANEVYYTGAAIIPNASADITLAGDTTQLIITDSSAFSFTFYELLDQASGGVDLSTLPGYETLTSGQYYVNSEPLDRAVSSGSYYVFVTFNENSAYSGNYASGSIWITGSDGALVAMHIVKGNMSVRVNNVNSEYNGLVGYNGRDVIYQEDGKWLLNTDLFTFSGVDLAGMDDLMTELKMGDIVITVSYVYGTDTATGERLATQLYTYTWEYDSASKVRNTPVKQFLPESIEDGRQVTGPYVGVDGFAVYDFGYAGYNTVTHQHEAAVYIIEISVDNTENSGSEYSSAKEAATDENGDPVIVNGAVQLVDVPHTASGNATVNPASVDFSMLYTTNFYNDGNDVLNGAYLELNQVGGDTEKANYILRGIAIPETGHLLTKGSTGANVEFTDYSVQLNNGTYYYETLLQSAVTIVVTNSAGAEVYRYANGSHSGAGITESGNYTFTFTFAGIPGKYMPFSYTGTFVQQKAEYHISVTQKEGANLSTEFGVEFNVSNIANQLEVTVELGDGFTTDTGRYTAFEEAVAASGGDMSALASYIKLVGTDGNISTEYNTNTYKSGVGSYFIYYVYTSVDSNLEIVMETASSVIEVTQSAPSFLVDSENQKVDEEKGLDLGSQAYTPNTSWNAAVLAGVGVGIEYKALDGPTGENYITKNVVIASIDYSTDGADWSTTVETISSVGKYRVTVMAEDTNLGGTLDGVYIYFEVTKISAQANVVVSNSDLVWSDDLGAYVATFNGAAHAVGYSVTAGGNAVSESSLQGTVHILISVNGESGEYVDIATSPIINAGSYWVMVTVEGSENYDVAPSEATKVTIDKADPTIRFEQSEYNRTFSMTGNTIPEGDYTFELNGVTAPGITAANSSVYYLSVQLGEGAGSAEVAQAQAKVAQMVNDFIASGEGDITAWLAAQSGYEGYAFTSIDGTPAATDVGYYFPVVIFNGDGNYNRSGALVANIPHPVITVTPAVLVLSASAIGDMSVQYGSAARGDITDIDEIAKYIGITWMYTNSNNQPEEFTQEMFDKYVTSFEYQLIDNNHYAAGTSVGTVYNAYLFTVRTFTSTNFVYTYDNGGYVNLQVTPVTIAFDPASATVSLTSDTESDGAASLANGDYTFERVYNGKSFGPLAFTYTGNTGLEINGDNAKNVDARGFGDYGVFTVIANGSGYTQEAVYEAGVYSGSITITLNNPNYTATGLSEGNTMTVDVNLNIEKAILGIDFDYLTFAAGDLGRYTETSAAGTGSHLGWYEYATIYTGANFDYNNRVYVYSYREVDGELVPYGNYMTGAKLSEVGGITESDGASGNLAAPGEYNIHLTLTQLATNYKFVDSAGRTTGLDASGATVDLSSLDINVTISPSTFVSSGNTLTDGDNPLFGFADGVYSREFDGTSLTASFLKGFLSVVPYKLSNTAGALQGSLAAPGNAVQLVADRDYAQEVIGSNLRVELLSGGSAVTSAMYVGDYTLRVTLNSGTHTMDAQDYALRIVPTDNISAKATVKGQTERTYNGLDVVPNLTLTVSVTDYNGKTHTIAFASYTVNVCDEEGEVLFSYDVTDGNVDTSAIEGKFRNAGTYEIKLVIDNANISVTEIATSIVYTINPRSLTDSGIRSSYVSLFNYRTTAVDNGDGTYSEVPVAVSEEDLDVLVTYNRRTDLVLGTDFEIDFGSGAGRYTGSYTFSIVGKGNYTGSIDGCVYNIGASVGIVSAPDAVVYGTDSITVRLSINSLENGATLNEGDTLILNFYTGISSIIVDAAGKTVAQLGVPSQVEITSSDIVNGEFTVVFTGLGAVNAGEYFLSLVFGCTYEGITTEGTINKEASGEAASKVVVDEADVEAAAAGVSATITSVNSTTVSFNIKGQPNTYEYSVDGGETWVRAHKGDNTVSGLAAGTRFSIMFRVNDVNYATASNVHEYPLNNISLSGTTTADVDEIIASANSLARNFNATGFARYAQLLQSVSAVSSGDMAARGDEIEDALAAVEEARAEYIEDLQAAINSAVSAAEKAAGKASGVSSSATAGIIAGGMAMPVLGVGLIFAAARRRKSKEDDLND